MQLSPPQTTYTKLLPSAQDHTATTSAPRESRFPSLYDISEIRPQNPAVDPLFNVTAAEDRHLTVLQTQVATTQKGEYCPQILVSQSAPKPTNQQTSLPPQKQLLDFTTFVFLGALAAHTVRAKVSNQDDKQPLCTNCVLRYLNSSVVLTSGFRQSCFKLFLYLFRPVQVTH